MNILHISFRDHGGSGNAAYRLHQALLIHGANSKFLCFSKKNDDPSVYLLDENGVTNKNVGENSGIKKLRGSWNTYKTLPESQVYEMFTGLLCVDAMENSEIWKSADIINLHWVAGMLDYNRFPEIFAGKKIVWTLHDMNAFSGGCHYAGECTRYQDGCCNCPMLGKADVDYAFSIWHGKWNAYEKVTINVVAPSKWLGECAQNSKLLSKFSVRVIPYSLDVENVFCPEPNQALRKQLGVEADEKFLLFISENIFNTRKGFSYLLAALETLPREGKIRVGVVGNTNTELFGTVKECLFPIGTVSDPKNMAALYNAADVFVIPSLEDNLPNVVLESIACGTPVVGFDIGGIPDMISHQKTGYLVPFKNTIKLAEGILWTLDNSQMMKSSCRKKAINKYSHHIQAGAYLALYESL